MTPDEQLEEWVNGNNLHNHEREECCPDFSCCQSHYRASPEERRLFVDRPDLRERMLMGFLGGAMADYDKTVHIAGSIDGEA